MVYILLIPYDVFTTVREYGYIFTMTDPFTSTVYAITVYDLYFCMYICMIWLVFIGLPFSYFYASIVQEEEDILKDEEINQGGRSQPINHYLSSAEESCTDDDEETKPLNPQASGGQGTQATAQAIKKRSKADKRAGLDASMCGSTCENIRRALKKTIASILCLIIMMAVSFTISNYEYKISKDLNTGEFEKAFERVNNTNDFNPD